MEMLSRKAVSDANPQHIRLKPLKSNGAVSDRNRAVKGVKARGDMMLANELMPVMHPWAIPCSKGPTFLDTVLLIHGCTKTLMTINVEAR